MSSKLDSSGFCQKKVLTSCSAPDGTETHTFLRGLTDPVERREVPGKFSMSAVSAKRQVPNVINQVGCGYYALNGNDANK